MAKRQVTESEKQAILAVHGMKCFIDGHPIESEEDLQFEHIHPYAEDGASTPDNVAPACRRHNREKGTMSLSEYRDRLGLKRFFEGVKKRWLDDLLRDRLGEAGFAQRLPVERGSDSIKLFLDEGAVEVQLQVCPATGESYFFANMPARHLSNDLDLQPRSLEPERLWELYRHLRTHTQLAPSVGRLVGDRVLLFDGQHKAAAQVWAGRPKVDCKIYLEPDVRRLKETNLTAHDKLRQMPFYTSTLMEKYADMAHEDWQSFLEAPGSKTEAAFMQFIRNRASLSKAEALKRIRAVLYRDILEHPDNRFRDYITEENKGRQNPITMYRLEKTFFSEFLTPPPLEDEFESENYHRDEERENLVFLFNLIVDKALDGKWNPERADAEHKKASRLFSAGALRAWVPFLRDAVAPALQLFRAEDRRRIFYRSLDENQKSVVEQLVERLLSHKVWVDPDPELNDLRYDNADRAKAMLDRVGLTPNWLLGGDS